MTDQVAHKRGFLDRALVNARPVVVRDFTPPMSPVAEGLWVVQRKIRLPGNIGIPTAMTVIRLSSNALLLHAPFRLDPVMRSELAALGKVAHLVAPGSFHYLYLAEHLAAFPDAEVHLAPGLRQRRPDVPAGTVLGDRPPAAWEQDLDQAVLGPSRGVSEVAFLHRATRTLILTDLAFNMQSATNAMERLYWRMSGVWHRIGPTLLVRRVLLYDRAVARAFVTRILEWDFDRIVMAHGDVVERDGHAAFATAFARYR